MPNIFTERPRYEDTDAGEEWILVDAVTCKVNLENPITKEPVTYITVPARFKTNFASIPKIFWFIYGPTGKYNRAALVHDYLYTCQRYSKKWCDKAFLDLMDQSEIGPWTRYPIYYSVKFFAFFAFNKCKKEALKNK